MEALLHEEGDIESPQEEIPQPQEHHHDQIDPFLGEIKGIEEQYALPSQVDQLISVRHSLSRITEAKTLNSPQK